MKTLSIHGGKEAVRSLVLEWNELLAQEKYEQALELMLYDNTQIVDEKLWIWTPERLQAAVATYGEPWYTVEELKALYDEPDWEEFKVTSVQTGSNGYGEISVEYFEEPLSEEMAETLGVLGLDYKTIVGDVEFDGVPLNGEASDLTARFWIKQVGEDQITLVFRDMHVL